MTCLAVPHGPQHGGPASG